MPLFSRGVATAQDRRQYKSVMDPGLAWSEGEARHDTSPPDAPDLADGLVAESERLRGFLRRVTQRPNGEVDDMVQESFARALHYQESFDRTRALWPWLKRIAWRVFLDQRSGNSPRALTLLDTVEEPAVFDKETTDVRDELHRLLRRLPPIERNVLVRFHQGGESVGELATDLGLPEGTVKSHLHRARRRLAQRTDKDMDDE